MILKASAGYWTTGISVRWHEYSGRRNGVPHGGWDARLDFHDDGFCDDEPGVGQVSTEGTLRTRYAVRDGETVSGLRAAVDALIADAQRMGITLGTLTGGPTLYYEGDGEDPDRPPPVGWRELLATEAARLGWECPSASMTEPTIAWVSVDDRGRLTPESTVTVGEWTWPVPEKAEVGGVLWMSRVGQALKKRGWRPVRDAEHQHRSGEVGVPVERIGNDG